MYRPKYFFADHLRFQAEATGQGKWRISVNGGDFPRWRRDGRELIYLGQDQMLMAVSVSAVGGSLNFGHPQPLFKIFAPAPVFEEVGSYPYDVAADGQRVIGFSPVAGAESSALTVVTHWQAALSGFRLR